MGSRLDEYSVASLVSGLLLVTVTLVIQYRLFMPLGYSPLSGVGVLWKLAGAFALGAVPVYCILRARLVTPLICTVGLYSYAALHSYSSILDAYEVGAALSATPMIFDLYLWGWFLPLFGALLIGGVEYLLQLALGFRHLEPDTGPE
ncbi:hypothetical protein [Natronobacterium texcoconense]|uniref:Uncharacterized protein n=1 Tax=Natronobacterium texcoconense TaxID=1095778 RepID=A0A1H1FE07_NATTX|nr:hypothetical protein [Natronobacterium texcoconense]SDQ99185.1 hypothetical protein SAMN04489842_1930 [Natronobacterium texcoconense]